MRCHITGRLLIKLLIIAVLTAIIMPFFVMRQPDMPGGTHVKSPRIPIAESQLRLLIDTTTRDAEDGTPIIDHEIFDAIIAAIHAADEFILVDFFLWNPWRGASEAPHRNLSGELVDALIESRRKHPEMPILAITDPINRIYGDQPADIFNRLQQAGIPVVFTRLDRLADSNRFYSPPARFWSMLLSSHAADSSPGPRLIPNPFVIGGQKITTGQLARLLYFKANHRKLIITGNSKTGPELIVTSMNPADGSSLHSNIALQAKGEIAQHALASEIAIAEWSNRPDWVHRGDTARVKETTVALNHWTKSNRQPRIKPAPPEPDNQPLIQFLTEGAIHSAVIDALYAAEPGDSIDIAMFYLSDRKIVNAIKNAARRGVSSRIILDANRDAFGRAKVGIPNRPVAAELLGFQAAQPIRVRWAITDGEQFHSKALRVVSDSPARDILILGSANFTRRNLGDLNLEANILLQNPMSIGDQFDTHFDELWNSSSHTTPFQTFQESPLRIFWKSIVYRFQEWSGASSF